MPEILDVDTEPVKTAQTNAPDTEPTGWMPLSDEQRNTAPENIRTLFETKKWSTIEDIANGYTGLEKLLGKGEHIFRPESPDDTEGWNKYWTSLGRPESYDKYEIPDDEEVPFEAELLDKWKQDAFRRGKSQEEMAGDIEFYRDMVKGLVQAEAEQSAARKEADIQALQLKWGNNYETKIKGARIIADSLGIYQTLEAKGLASDPVIIEMLDTIASRSDEDVITPQTPAVQEKTPIEERDEIMKNPAFKDKFARGRKELMKRYMELNQIIANAGQASQPNSR